MPHTPFRLAHHEAHLIGCLLANVPSSILLQLDFDPAELETAAGLLLRLDTMLTSSIGPNWREEVAL